MIKTSNGFISISFLVLLPLLILLTSLYVFTQLTVHHSDQFNVYCLKDLRTLQKKITTATDQIVALNPYSTLLRQQITMVTLALATAVSTQNYPLIAEMTIQLNRLKTQQKQLDQVQRTLISKANLDILIFQQQMQKKIDSTNKQQLLKLKTITDYVQSTKIIKYASLGLIPDSISGLAPNYKLSNSYIEEHRVVLFWQFKTIKSTYQRQCSLGTKKEGQHWRLIIKRDKF